MSGFSDPPGAFDVPVSPSPATEREVKSEPGSPHISVSSSDSEQDEDDPVTSFSTPPKDPLFLPSSSIEDTPRPERKRGRTDSPERERSVSRVRTNKPPVSRGMSKQKAGTSGRASRSPTPISSRHSSRAQSRNVSRIRANTTVRTPLLDGPPPPNQLQLAQSKLTSSLPIHRSPGPSFTWEEANKLAEQMGIESTFTPSPAYTKFQDEFGRHIPLMPTPFQPTTPAVDTLGRPIGSRVDSYVLNGQQITEQVDTYPSGMATTSVLAGHQPTSPHTPRLPRGARFGTIPPELGADEQDFAHGLKDIMFPALTSQSFTEAMRIIDGGPAQQTQSDIIILPEPIPIKDIVQSPNNLQIPQTEASTLLCDMGQALNIISNEQRNSRNRETFSVAQIHNLTHLVESVIRAQIIHTDNIKDVNDDITKYTSFVEAKLSAVNDDIASRINNVHDHLGETRTELSKEIYNVARTNQDILDTRDDINHIRRENVVLSNTLRTMNDNIAALTAKIEQLSTETRTHSATADGIDFSSDTVDYGENSGEMDCDAPVPMTRSAAPSPPSSFPTPAALSNIIQQSVTSAVQSTVNAAVNSAVQSTVNAAVSSALLPVRESISSVSKGVDSLRNSRTAQTAQPKPQPVSQARIDSAPNTAPPTPIISSQDFLGAFDDAQPPHPRADPESFRRFARSAHPSRLTLWARILSWGRWGPIHGKSGKPVGFRKDSSPEQTLNFVLRSVDRAFSMEGPGYIPHPPNSNFDSKGLDAITSCKFYPWVASSGAKDARKVFNKDAKSGQPLPLYPPGFAPPSFPGLRDFISTAPTTSPSPTTTHVTPAQDDPTFGDFLGDFPNNGLPQQPQVEIGGDQWNVVTRRQNNGGKTVSFAQVAAAAASDPAPTALKKTPKIPPPGDRWLLRFPKGKGPSKAEQSDPMQIIDILNRACTPYKIRAVLATWTKEGNLSFRFTHDSTVRQITTAAETIASTFSPKDHEGRPISGATFKKVVPWSKVVLKNVLLRPPMTQEDYEMIDKAAEDDTTVPPKAPWTPEALEKEVRAAIHTLPKDTLFTFRPDWTRNPTTYSEETHYGNISFAFDDPDESIGKAVLSHAVYYMFGRKVYPYEWKENVNPTQCSRCFKYGPAHVKCDKVCRICASRTHVEGEGNTEHNVNCQKCINSGKSFELLKLPSWKCPHFRCPCCGEKDHPAGDRSCKGRDISIAAARSRKPGMRGQSILSRDSFRRKEPEAPNNSAEPDFSDPFQPIA